MSKLNQSELHRAFITALGGSVFSAQKSGEKPLDAELGLPVAIKIRAYIFNVTRPPGGRPTGEHKIQLIAPGQVRTGRGDFDWSSDRSVLLIGFQPELEVFVLWDADLYRQFAYSRNVQVKGETVYAAFAGGLAFQTRRTANTVETVVAARGSRLMEAIQRHLDQVLVRLLK